jgi:hypothetical protein
MTQISRRSVPGYLAVALLAAALLAPAQAGAKVPLKKYECYQFDPTVGYLYGGGFTLKKRGKYTATTGGGGKWSTPNGKRVNFKTGPYRYFYGKMRKDAKGNPVMDLYLKQDPDNSQACYPGGKGP